MTEADLSRYLVWNIDPVMLRIGGASIRYYSVCLFLAFALGYAIWHVQMLRVGHALLPTSRIILWSAAGVLIGGRLAHCLLYEPDHYLRHPLAILDLSGGGLASHGSALGLCLATWFYARRYRYSYVEMLDRLALPCMLGAALVRIGNFFNSEIVGREWTGAWALRFEGFAARNQVTWEAAHGALGWQARALPRHPAQLYEAAGILAIFALLALVEWRMGARRSRGLLAGLMLALYFSFRFGIEYTKEFQPGVLQPDPVLHVIRVVSDASLTLGQWLSIPFALFGIGAVIAALRRSLPPTRLSPWDVSESAPGRAGSDRAKARRR